jgi:hypothetical protein
MCLKYKKTTSRSLLSREDNGFIEEIYVKKEKSARFYSKRTD